MLVESREVSLILLCFVIVLGAYVSQVSQQSRMPWIESFKVNEESQSLNIRFSNLNDRSREVKEKATDAACLD
jgi:cell division protein FtsL